MINRRSLLLGLTLVAAIAVTGCTTVYSVRPNQPCCAKGWSDDAWCSHCKARGTCVMSTGAKASAACSSTACSMKACAPCGPKACGSCARKACPAGCRKPCCAVTGGAARKAAPASCPNPCCAPGAAATQKACPAGCPKPCCAQKDCPAGCAKPCCEKKACPAGCTMPCCAKAHSGLKPFKAGPGKTVHNAATKEVHHWYWGRPPIKRVHLVETGEIGGWEYTPVWQDRLLYP